MLNEEDNIRIFDFVKNITTKDNVLTFYSLAKLFNQATISDSALIYIQRWFSIEVETESFLHLDFDLIAKILASSELNIYSEVEIFYAVKIWLKHSSEQRRKYAKKLLLKVRFTLLSEHAFKYISASYSTFGKNQEDLKTLKEVYTNRLKNKSSSWYTNRYCSQNMFNIVRCGGCNVKSNIVVNTVKQLSGIDLNKTKVLSSMKFKRKNCHAVFLKGEVYVFGGCNSADNMVKSVEKYTPSTNKWSKVTDMFDSKGYFCVCTFMN